MPTINVQISNIKRKGNNVHLTITDSLNRVIERTLNRDDINNWNDFATWLVNQSPDYELVPDKEKNLSITFHTEIIDGFPSKVVDSVIAT